MTGDSSADDNRLALSPDGEWIALRLGRDGGGIFEVGAAAQDEHGTLIPPHV